MLLVYRVYTRIDEPFFFSTRRMFTHTHTRVNRIIILSVLHDRCDAENDYSDNENIDPYYIFRDIASRTLL